MNVWTVFHVCVLLIVGASQCHASANSSDSRKAPKKRSKGNNLTGTGSLNSGIGSSDVTDYEEEYVLIPINGEEDVAIVETKGSNVYFHSCPQCSNGQPGQICVFLENVLNEALLKKTANGEPEKDLETVSSLPTITDDQISASSSSNLPIPPLEGVSSSPDIGDVTTPKHVPEELKDSSVSVDLSNTMEMDTPGVIQYDPDTIQQYLESGVNSVGSSSVYSSSIYDNGTPGVSRLLEQLSDVSDDDLERTSFTEEELTNLLHGAALDDDSIHTINSDDRAVSESVPEDTTVRQTLDTIDDIIQEDVDLRKEEILRLDDVSVQYPVLELGGEENSGLPVVVGGDEPLSAKNTNPKKDDKSILDAPNNVHDGSSSQRGSSVDDSTVDVEAFIQSAVKGTLPLMTFGLTYPNGFRNFRGGWGIGSLAWPNLSGTVDPPVDDPRPPTHPENEYYDNVNTDNVGKDPQIYVARLVEDDDGKKSYQVKPLLNSAESTESEIEEVD